MSVYLDDILIFSESIAEHCEHVLAVIKKIERYILKIKLTKCDVAKPLIVFLGKIISRGTIRQSTERNDTLFKYSRPTTLKQKSFLGLAGALRKFIPDFAKRATPLTDLLKQHDTQRMKNTKITISWNDAAEVSLQDLRSSVTSDSVLALPNFDLMFVLDTDACNYAVGAVLQQESPSRQSSPIAFFSKHLISPQQNYSTTEKELIAIVLSVEHFA